MECLPFVRGDLELAFGEVHIETQLASLLSQDRMALRRIDPQPRPDEVSLHPPGHPDVLSESDLHEHEVVEVGKQLEKPKGKAIIHKMMPLPLEPNYGS